MRVIDFRLDVVEILDSDYWNLPADTRRLFELYARPLPSAAGTLRFELAIYRWAEIQATLNRIAGVTGTPDDRP